MKQILILALLLVAPALLRAESESTANPPTPTPPGVAKGTTPTVVTSDQFKMDMANHIGVFTGNVLMVGADFKMKSREMTVFFDDKNSVKRMLSRGDVVIEQPDRTTKAGQSEYFNDDNKIILTESPQVVDNQRTVTGTTITMYRNNNKMDVDGHSRVLIYGDTADGSKPAAPGSPATTTK